MDNLKAAAADWIARAERWSELLQFGRQLFAYGFLVSPREVASWYLGALEHDPMLDAQGASMRLAKSASWELRRIRERQPVRDCVQGSDAKRPGTLIG
jgi:hypothetical protein